MKLKIFLLVTALLPMVAPAQDWNAGKYLAGAVPQNEQGIVTFSKSYEVPGKTRADIFEALKQYVQQDILKGENAQVQSRLVEDDAAEGLLAARVDEYLYFRRQALVTHRTRFLYELVCQVEDGRFSIEMRRLRYIYEEEETPGNIPLNFTAEEWISDKEALTKSGKLLRKTRNFRVYTIERKDAIFAGAAKAVGVQ